MSEWLSIEELYDAYLDCMHRKRRTIAASVFEQNEASNLCALHEELNNRTYKIGYSNAFCVTRPKLREVFAADFRDRIVHHLLIMKLGKLFEADFIENTYNCRKGKGTDYGVRKVYDMAQRHKDGWCLCFDVKGFFMHIDKKILWQMLESFIRDRYKGDDIEHILWLTKMVVMHKPEQRCIKKGDVSLWAGLEKDKSLFTNGDNLGLAIGNLTSQIFANFYLSGFDHWMESIEGIEYGRYVDDGRVISDNKDTLLKLIPEIRRKLSEIGMTLHPRKISIQRVDKGIPFVGSIIKRDRIYIQNRTVGNTESVIDFYNNLSLEDKESGVERFVQRVNSYFGFMVNRKTYAIRRRLCAMLDKDDFRFVYIKGRMKSLRVKKKYKTTTKLYKRYGKISMRKRKFRKSTKKTRNMVCKVVPYRK